MSTRFLKTLLKTLCVTGLLSLPMTLTAQTQPPDNQFEQLLVAIDTVPSKASLDARWPDVVQRLTEATTDPERSSWARQRAISLLSFYPTPEVNAHLKHLTRDNDDNVRQTAVYTLGRTFGATADPSLVDTISSVAIKDPSPKVRDRAIRALRWIEHPTALDALRSIAATRTEHSDLVKYVLQRRSQRQQPQ